MIDSKTPITQQIQKHTEDTETEPTLRRIKPNKPYRPNPALSQMYLQEQRERRATTSTNVRDDGTVLADKTCPSVPPLLSYPDIYSQIPMMYDY
jgi:hypothetical protein